MTHDSATTRVGFIGLGVMGVPMAGHLVAAGYPLSAFDVDPSALDSSEADPDGVVWRSYSIGTSSSLTATRPSVESRDGGVLRRTNDRSKEQQHG